MLSRCDRRNQRCLRKTPDVLAVFTYSPDAYSVHAGNESKLIFATLFQHHRLCYSYRRPSPIVQYFP
jgi:hypothetical protein